MFQSSSNSLNKLVIEDGNRRDLIPLYRQIPVYLYSLIHLKIPVINQRELISIFKSCSQLVSLSMILDDNKDLENLGKFIPKTLRKIDFILEVEIHYEESLKCFLEGYENNSGSLECLELVDINIILWIN